MLPVYVVLNHEYDDTFGVIEGCVVVSDSGAVYDIAKVFELIDSNKLRKTILGKARLNVVCTIDEGTNSPIFTKRED